MTELAPLPEQVPRTFTSAPGSKYMLPSDEQEKQRLEFQHRLMTGLYEGRLILAPVNLPDGATVLDSGTGTGIWTVEVADKLPSSTQLYAIDIEARLFPTIEPKHEDRVHLSVASVTSLPAEWNDKFDLVNQRLFIAALQQHEWDAAVRELFRVTKPGGWIQLFEFAKWQGPGPKSDIMMELCERLWASRGLVYDITKKLPKMLQDAGFVGVQVEKRGAPVGKWAGQLGIDGRINLAGISRGFKTAVLKAGGVGIVKTEAEYDELVDQSVEEWDNMPAPSINLEWIVAQKPV